VDGSNNVIVTGYSTNSATGYDYATIKYSSDGVPLWTNRYNGPTSGNDYADAVAVDGSNDVIVTGFPATIKYSSTGATLWTKLDNITGADAAVDRSGNVIVTGVSPSNNYDFATIKYICVPEPVLTGLQPTNGTFQMRVDDVLQPGTLVVEAATNLTGWKAIFTNTTPSNVLFYTDPKASNYVRRFYRAFQFP
jgi:hypothetical protein